MKNKAVFLDRDGVINKEIGDYITNVADFELLPGVGAQLKRLQEAGYLLIVITNQAGIAKGLYTHETLAAIHQKMTDGLQTDTVKFAEIYYSPDHPDYTGKSLSRKPNSGMIEKAIGRYQLNPALCYMIGDKDRDIQAAEAVGVKGYKIASNENIERVANEILH